MLTFPTLPDAYITSQRKTFVISKIENLYVVKRSL